MPNKQVFVTVGTTQFPELIDKASSPEVLDILSSMGFTVVQFQVGHGPCKEHRHPSMTLKYEQYFDDFDQQIKDSDLVISHAGAGTCLEVLRQHKPLIVVINENLMDNHQTELAEQLAQDGYVKCCTVSDLPQTLRQLSSNVSFKPYPKPDIHLFSNYLDKCMGFI